MARYDLKLSGDDFYDLTPRQLDALLKRHRSERESHELLFAQIASAIYNTGFRTTEKPVTPLDFMPSQWAKKTRTKPKSTRIRMTKKHRQAIADGLRAALLPIAKVIHG